MSTTRRLYLYLVTLVALGVMAGGVGQLVSLLLDLVIRTGTAQVGRVPFSNTQLSLGLAMTVIGAPLWFFFWRSIQQRAAGNADETGAALRKLYLNLVLLVTAFTAIGGGASSLMWLLAGASRERSITGSLASFIVAGAVWVYHRNTSESEGHPSPKARTLRRWYVYILSGFGMVWFAEALVEFVSAGVLALPVWGNTLVSTGFWTGSTQTAVTGIVLGSLVWYYHWFRMGKGDFDSVLRQVYFYLLAITGGAIAALVAATVTLQRIITWALGGVTGSLGAHFQFLGWAVPTMVIGTAIWGYHQRLVREESARLTERRQSSERVHHYLMSFIGLGTMAGGLILLFAVIIDLAIGVVGRSITAGTGWWQSLLGLCLSMLASGTPLWLYYWRRVLRRADSGGIEEWRASSRRIFLYSVVVICIGVLIADLINIVYQVVNGILQGRTDAIVRESRWSIQTLLVAAPILWYHLRIIRVDQRRGAEAVVTRKAVTLLTYDRTGALASRLSGLLGYQVNSLYRSGAGQEAAITEEDLARIAAEIRSASASKVMVSAVEGKFVVVPYEER